MTATDIALWPPLDSAARPWPGLDAFSEALQAFFFGRAAETEELYRRIRGETVTLLFGQSGLGKTSLLRWRASAATGARMGYLKMPPMIEAKKITKPTKSNPVTIFLFRV